MTTEKQSLTTLAIADFTGGMNSAVSPQSLAENEYQVIHNFEFNFNKLVTRGGLSSPLATYDTDIWTTFWDEGTNEFIVVLTNGDIYEEDLDTKHLKVGTLTGTERPTFCCFDSKVFIASGAKLQYFDYTTQTVTTIEASYNCDQVFERFGRLVTSQQGDDNLYYSATGDPYETGWEDDSNDDSTSKWTEIGYKDNGDILKTLPISGDIAIFKTNGRVYSLSSEYPNWTISQIAEHTDVINYESIVVVGSDIVFMTHLGLKSLTTTATYGNFTTDEIARKINRNIMASIYKPRLHNLVRKRQLVIFPNTNGDEQKKCFVYQYDIGAGMEMEFTYPIVDMQDTINDTVIASGKSLYRWSQAYDTDNGTAIDQLFVTRQISSSGRLYTRRVDFGVTGTEGEEIEIDWANKVVKHAINNKRRVHNVFSVCRDSILAFKTKTKVAIEYIKLYLFEGV